jgi:hypothetical protein
MSMPDMSSARAGRVKAKAKAPARIRVLDIDIGVLSISGRYLNVSGKPLLR